MAIRLGNGCTNCENLGENHMCKVHMVKVDNHYTCDHFMMKSALADSRSCVTCSRYHESDCAHPNTAAPGMLCSQWAPQNAQA